MMRAREQEPERDGLKEIVKIIENVVVNKRELTDLLVHTKMISVCQFFSFFLFRFVFIFECLRFFIAQAKSRVRHSVYRDLLAVDFVFRFIHFRNETLPFQLGISVYVMSKK